VILLSGAGSKDKTPRKVLSVMPKEGKVIVEGVNVMKDRQKNKGGSARTSGINQQDVIEKPFPIFASKVALVDPKTKKPTRVTMKIQDGKRVRVAVKSGETI
jgi:large subunit ribosomal protein L24